MKRIFSIYKPYMLHAIFYKGVTRLSVAAAACLVWENFVSDGIFTLWEGPVLVCGIAFLAWAWTSYLSLDGLSPRRLFTAGRTPEKSKKRRHATSSMVDYADEHIVSFDELEPEERTFCSLATNLVLGSAMTLIGLAAGAL